MTTRAPTEAKRSTLLSTGTATLTSRLTPFSRPKRSGSGDSAGDASQPTLYGLLVTGVCQPTATLATVRPLRVALVLADVRQSAVRAAC